MTHARQPLLSLARTAGQALVGFSRTGGSARGYYWGPAPDCGEKAWAEAGFAPVPDQDLGSTDPEAFLSGLLGLADTLARANGHNPLWWATDIASRNRFESPLTPLLNCYALSLAAMRAARRDDRDLVLIGLPAPVLRQVRRNAADLGFSERSPQSGLACLVERLRGELLAWRGLAAGLRESLRRIRLVARSQTGPERRLPTGPVALLKSFAYQTSFAANGAFRDPFFGPLPRHMSQVLGPKAAVLTVCVGFGDEAQCARLMRNAPEGHVLPLEDFLRPGDAVQGFLHLALNRLLRPFRAPANANFLGSSTQRVELPLIDCIADCKLTKSLQKGGNAL